MTTAHHAVVLGASIAGTLAASVLAHHIGPSGTVTIVDRDQLPDGAEARTGVPQGRHAHVLWSGGARLIEAILPGTLSRLAEAGARRIGVQSDMLLLSAAGWCERFPETQYMIACGRPLLEAVIRSQALRIPGVAVLPYTDVISLAGDARRVGGVRVRSRADGTETVLDADIVVDATGRGSGLSRWLTALGVPAPEEEVIESSLSYATRVFQPASDAARFFPVVSLHADHRSPRAERNALVVPAEDGSWIVSLSGTRPPDEVGFAEFAARMRHPIVAQMIATAEPLTPVYVTRSTTNRRLRYERIPAWPDGLIVLGDAMSALNPVYGHGMVAAAQGATALGIVLDRHGLADGLARAAVRAIAAAVDDAWIWAASQDMRFPESRAITTDPRLSSQVGDRARFADILQSIATRDRDVNAAMVDVMSMSVPLSRLESPDVVSALRRARLQPPLGGPELSAVEVDALAPRESITPGPPR